jgi:SAM-dependent methyltransferase
MNKMGYNTFVADAQYFEFNDRFDVIVGGEIIEHLENPGLFFESCRRHLNDDGCLIITTPNPRRLNMLLWFLLKNHNMINPEHTMWFDYITISELADRAGFDLQSYECYRPLVTPVTLTLYKLGIAKPLTAGGWVFIFKIHS